MITKIEVRNFKRFETVEVELGDAVVLVGPNNSGKTSALQALALWEAGLKKWLERRAGSKTPEKRPGVTINRRELVSVPVPTAKALWRDLHVRETGRDDQGKQRTRNVLVEIIVSGVTDDRQWECGIEFDYANEESFYCRPLRIDPAGHERMPIPDEASRVNLAFLPPMSGLAATERRLDGGAVSVLIGEGRTAEVLRNLCWQLYAEENGAWQHVVAAMERLFGVALEEPKYLELRGELVMHYRDRRGVRLEISSAGRGLHQTLLLLAYLNLRRGSVLLLDEPDAHLEILRQRQTYELLTSATENTGGQLVVATHSEVLLNEAADRDIVVAFVGRPHRIDDRGHQVKKALKEIGFEDYYQAEQRGWVLYLEGSTDLAILRGFASRLGHLAAPLLQAPFVHYVGNNTTEVQRHFFGLREAKTDLVGVAIYDRLGSDLPKHPGLDQAQWRRREIEGYLCQSETLISWAKAQGVEKAAGRLFEESVSSQHLEAMQECIEDLVPRVALRNPGDPWWTEERSSAFLKRLFKLYYEKLGLPDLMRKSDYHRLVPFVPSEVIDAEIAEKLDLIVKVEEEAQPRED